MGHVDLINMLYKSDLRSFLSYFLKMEVEYDNVKHDIYIGAGQGNLKHFNAKYIGAGIWKSVLVRIASSSFMEEEEMRDIELRRENTKVANTMKS